MVWFKVDDSFYDHPKVFDAPDCAVALWTRAGSWSARNLRDGFVPAGMPARLCDDPDTAVRELVDRGLWRRAKGGYQFHEWHRDGDGTTRNPSADEVRELRAKRAEAGRRGGKAKAAKQTASNGLASASGVGKQNATPTRPDPDASNEASVGPRSKTKRGTRIPEPFVVTDEMKRWKATNCPDVDGWPETERFIDYWRGVSGQKGVKTDWPATWRNWLRKAQDDAPSRPGNAVAARDQPRPSRADAEYAKTMALAEELEGR